MAGEPLFPATPDLVGDDTGRTCNLFPSPAKAGAQLGNRRKRVARFIISVPQLGPGLRRGRGKMRVATVDVPNKSGVTEESGRITAVLTFT